MRSVIKAIKQKIPGTQAHAAAKMIIGSGTVQQSQSQSQSQSQRADFESAGRLASVIRSDIL